MSSEKKFVRGVTDRFVKNDLIPGISVRNGGFFLQDGNLFTSRNVKKPLPGSHRRFGTQSESVRRCFCFCDLYAAQVLSRAEASDAVAFDLVPYKPVGFSRVFADDRDERSFGNIKMPFSFCRGRFGAQRDGVNGLFRTCAFSACSR